MIKERKILKTIKKIPYGYGCWLPYTEEEVYDGILELCNKNNMKYIKSLINEVTLNNPEYDGEYCDRQFELVVYME